ncbi:Protein kinase containing WD40 repeats [Ceraceosorus bombacis]|uniref:non-specific serine/threonine protein kinase n=1 Tax=Ceraceosorus bombacis TaxID=401625 RepID=A0A0P1B8V0_9BASI|nr:Protein kinase containing WD40 repeats [Ceraceosorus bombacis]
MGNTTSSSGAVGSRLPPNVGLGNLIQEADGELQYDQSMGSSRFLRAARAKHRHGQVVVKAYLKPDASMSLRPMMQLLKTGYVLRQWLAHNLYDRISTRPFLTTIEKKWITYQLLVALRDVHARKMSHGDLKCENILITSSLNVYVTDFSSSFKPCYLPLHDPADFNYFFGTSGRRTCYVAPERFYKEAERLPPSSESTAPAREGRLGHSSAKESRQDAQGAVTEVSLERFTGVTEQMDVFSMGCVLAELWRDGSPTFTLTQLFKYREKQYDVEQALSEVQDADIRTLIHCMIQLSPSSRGSFDDALRRARGNALPEIFYSFMGPYLTELQKLSGRATSVRQDAASSAAAAAMSAPLAPSSKANTPTQSAAASTSGKPEGLLGNASLQIRAESDERIERLFEEWSDIVHHLDGGRRPVMAGALSDDPFGDADVETTYNANKNARSRQAAERVLPVQLHIPGLAPQALSRRTHSATTDGPALLILTPLLASLRSAVRPSSKTRALELLLHLSSGWLTEEVKLDRVLPYMIALLKDVESVRAPAVRAIAQLLLLIDKLTPANTIVFQEYLMPNLRRLATDASPMVRTMYASCIAKLCESGERFLQLAQALRLDGDHAYEEFGEDAAGEDQSSSQSTLNPQAEEGNYDAQLNGLRAFFQEQVTTLLTDTSISVKRALLANIAPLCSFFGTTSTNDVFLSHMITYLNDRSWALRCSFFDAIVGVAHVVGQASFEEYILPLMLQALSDPEEAVVLHVFDSLIELFGADSSTTTNLVRSTDATRDIQQAKHSLPCRGQVVSRAKLSDVVSCTVGFLCHPNYWLRLRAATLLELTCANSSTTDVWALIYPQIRPLLRADLACTTELELLQFVKTPLSRPVLSAATMWAARVGKTSFWKPTTDSHKNGLGREGISLIARRKGKHVWKTALPRSEEDDGYLDKLRAAGLAPDDEIKLVALRDYIWKLARQSSSRQSVSAATSGDDGISKPLIRQGVQGVQSIEGVTPLTILFSTRGAGKGNVGTGKLDTQSIGQGSSRSKAQESFSNQIARRRLAGSRVPSEMGTPLGPLAELKKKSKAADDASEATDLLSRRQQEPSQANLPSTLQASAVPVSPPSSASAAQGGLGIGKAAPAVGASAALATGTMSDLAMRLQGLDQGKAGAEANEAAAFSSNYAGDDPYIKAHLEAAYFANFRDRPSIWGPNVPAGFGPSSRRRGMRAASATSRTTSSGGSNRRPEGSLVAYFTEHTASVSGIVVSPDQAFFVSGSMDGTLKVWDTARLEKNVTSHSRATYSAQSGGVTALTILEGTHCVASASMDGSVHIVRVDVNAASSLPKYGKLRLVSNFQLSRPGEHALCLLQSSATSAVSSSHTAETGSATLILGTSASKITILDLRTMQVLQTLSNPSHFGPITCMCSDKRNIWLLVGTLGGVLALWDLRFSLLLKSWRIGDPEGTEAAKRLDAPRAAVVRINRVIPHPSKGRGRLVLVAFERIGDNSAGRAAAQGHSIADIGTPEAAAAIAETMVEVWDIDKCQKVESFDVTTDRKFSNGQRSQVATSSEGAQQRSLRHVRGGSADGTEAKGAQSLTPLQSAASGPHAGGLGSAAQAIERFVKLQEASLEARTTAPSHLDGEATSTHAEIAAASLQDVATQVPSAKALYVSLEGYTSSAPASHVPGGWVDAGKLASDDAQTNEHSGLTGTAQREGPAGYMLSGGADRTLRFWDLGRVEKSVSFASGEERGEFWSHTSTCDGAPVTLHIHTLPQSQHKQRTNSNGGGGSHSSAAAQKSTAPARSPLLTHQQTEAQSLMRAHKDAITALNVIESPFRCVVAGDASGTIRVWE